MAQDALSGRNVWLGIGKQASFDLPVIPTKFFEVTDIGGILEDYEFKKSDRRVGTRFKPLGFKSARKVPLNFTVEVNAENIGLLMTLGLGADAVSAAGSAYQHAISLSENLPYFTALISTDLVADVDAADTLHQIANLKVISLKLDGAVDDVLKCTIEAVGTTRVPAYVSKSGITCAGSAAATTLTGFSSVTGIVAGQSVTGTGVGAAAKVVSVDRVAKSIVVSVANAGTVSSITVTSPTPTFPSTRSLYMKAEESQGKLELGANVGGLAQFDEGSEFHLSISNGVAADMRINNTAYASSLREGDSEITGSLKLLYNRASFAEVQAFQAGTQRALRMTATSTELAATGQPYKVLFTADKVRYSGAPASWDPDAISLDGQYEVEKTTSYPTLVIINTDSAAY